MLTYLTPRVIRSPSSCSVQPRVSSENSEAIQVYAAILFLAATIDRRFFLPG